MTTMRRQTPWGRSDHVTDVGPGVEFHSTPSHGGYWIEREVLDRIPPAHRAYAKRWGGSEQWYEEDVAWAAVARAFPEFFPARALPEAEALIAHYFPKEVAA